MAVICHATIMLVDWFVCKLRVRNFCKLLRHIVFIAFYSKKGKIKATLPHHFLTKVLEKHYYFFGLSDHGFFVQATFTEDVNEFLEKKTCLYNKYYYSIS